MKCDFVNVRDCMYTCQRCGMTVATLRDDAGQCRQIDVDHLPPCGYGPFGVNGHVFILKDVSDVQTTYVCQLCKTELSAPGAVTRDEMYKLATNLDKCVGKKTPDRIIEGNRPLFPTMEMLNIKPWW